MLPVKRITISGFRGILAPLDLSFDKGSSIRSMAIYGPNGTGKSSVTDAWEWFHTGKIERLGREGAGPGAYPHRDAGGDATYVEMEFADASLGTVRLKFDAKRITKPRANGNIETFRDLVPHPCHVRYEDLTRFVYFTKAEKYDALAHLMGFTPQVEVQKGLRRCMRQLNDKLTLRAAEVERIEKELAALTSGAEPSETGLLRYFTPTLERRGIAPPSTLADLDAAGEQLRVQVEQDPRAQELADLRTLMKALQDQEIRSEATTELKAYVERAEAFVAAEREAIDLVRIGVYEQGKQVLERNVNERGVGADTDRCPLCGQTYAGDLLQHVLEELEALKELKHTRDTWRRGGLESTNCCGPCGIWISGLATLSRKRRQRQSSFRYLI